MLAHRKWSKVKKRIDSFICNSLKGRVQFNIANYRKAHDQLGRVFVTVDKKEVLNMCTLTSDIALYKKEGEIRWRNDMEYDIENYYENIDIAEKAHHAIKEKGIFAQYDFFEAVEEYFDMSIADAKNANNMVIKILMLIDRRIGKRTLEAMEETISSELDIIQYFYQLRCKAEGIN